MKVRSVLLFPGKTSATVGLPSALVVYSGAQWEFRGD